MTLDQPDDTSPSSAPGRSLRDEDEAVRLILGEVAELAGRASMLWTRAVGLADRDPDEALSLLTDLEVLLEHRIRSDVEFLLTQARSALDSLYAAHPELTSHDDRTGPEPDD